MVSKVNSEQSSFLDKICFFFSETDPCVRYHVYIPGVCPRVCPGATVSMSQVYRSVTGDSSRG